MNREEWLTLTPDSGVNKQQSLASEVWEEPFFVEEDSEILGPPFDQGRLIYKGFKHKSMSKEKLLTTLQYQHFMSHQILLDLKHTNQANKGFTAKGCIESADAREITVRLAKKTQSYVTSVIDLNDYRLRHLLIDDGLSLLVVPISTDQKDGNTFTLDLPSESYAYYIRESRRYKCHKTVKVELPRAEVQEIAELRDFSSRTFTIRIQKGSPIIHCFSSEYPLIVQTHDEKTLIFSGSCRRIREKNGTDFIDFVLEIQKTKCKSIGQKQIRNPRKRLVPQPTLSFKHPFSEKRIQLDVFEMSTSGFTVYENIKESVLMEGMTISELVIEFAGSLRVKCSGRVIYRYEEENKVCRAGISILDMDINAYTCLSDILGRAVDFHSHISNKIDMEELWEFFFDTGFIYPKKYLLIQSRRDQLKENFRKLYEESPQIARHFVYQDNGRIFAHISMIRAYEKAWLIQHHAARNMGGRRGGFAVLRQIMYFLYDMHKFPQAKMDHAMCYFRPQNRFPNKVFGGFAESLNNPRGCSMDLFSYLIYPTRSLGSSLPNGWRLQDSSLRDIDHLRDFYSQNSGGLLLDMLGLPVCGEKEKLEKLYQELGFLRSYRMYSLTFLGKLMAVLIVNHSALGLNMSEVLNGIKIIVTDRAQLSWKNLSLAIGQLTGLYTRFKVPVMIYPSEYTEENNIPYEKQYQLWILSVKYAKEYMSFMRKSFRIGFE
jgi:hypothetical protein